MYGRIKFIPKFKAFSGKKVIVSYEWSQKSSHSLKYLTLYEQDEDL